MVVNDNERQTFDAFGFQQMLDRWVSRKLGWILRQAESLDRVPLALEPIQVRSESWQRRVNLRSTNACGTAHRSIKYLYFSHCSTLIVIV